MPDHSDDLSRFMDRLNDPHLAGAMADVMERTFRWDRDRSTDADTRRVFTALHQVKDLQSLEGVEAVIVRDHLRGVFHHLSSSNVAPPGSPYERKIYAGDARHKVLMWRAGLLRWKPVVGCDLQSLQFTLPAGH